MPLQLRPFNEGDELTARAARPLFAGSDFDYLSDFQENEPWSHWMLRMDRYRRSLGLLSSRSEYSESLKGDIAPSVSGPATRIGLGN